MNVLMIWEDSDVSNHDEVAVSRGGEWVAVHFTSWSTMLIRDYGATSYVNSSSMSSHYVQIDAHCSVNPYIRFSFVIITEYLPEESFLRTCGLGLLLFSCSCHVVASVDVVAVVVRARN